jgi:hypothetical protein
VLDGAVASCDLVKLRWVYQRLFGTNGYMGEPTGLRRTARAAIISGSVDVVRWLHDTHGVWPASSFESLAENKSVNIQAFFQDLLVCDVIANGSADRLRALQDRWQQRQADTVVYTANYMQCAAAAGSIEMCQYLRTEQLCPWDETVTTAAAASGSAALLRWLRDTGCPWNLDDVCAAATSAGPEDRTDMHKYLVQENGICVQRLFAAAVRGWLRVQVRALPAPGMHLKLCIHCCQGLCCSHVCTVVMHTHTSMKQPDSLSGSVSSSTQSCALVAVV